uniref:Uncharacterized protein n=1 Tax=Periophthalmus magnuspinnatus TaxID=409849 RepID=A0A3B4A2R3_9GOBI
MNIVSDSVPLQANMYYSDGEHAVMVQQHTRVNVAREMPKDHIIWSLCCFLYFNPCCLGLAALICSVKARDRKLLGDIEAARKHGSTAQTLNIISTVFFCIFILIMVIVVAVLFTQFVKIMNMINDGRNYDGYDRGGYSG